MTLARAGRDPVSLSEEFEPTAETIRKWVAAAGRQEGGRERGDAPAAAGDGLCATERDELARLRRENRQLRVERDILSRAGAWFARDWGGGVRFFRFMSANQAVFPVATMARVLGVSKAGYYAWLKRPAFAHALADASLLKRVRTIRASSYETYGSPRVHAELWAGREKHGRERVAGLMRAAGLVGASRRWAGLWRSATAARRPMCAHLWGRSATPVTTPCAKLLRHTGMRAAGAAPVRVPG